MLPGLFSTIFPEFVPLPLTVTLPVAEIVEVVVTELVVSIVDRVEYIEKRPTRSSVELSFAGEVAKPDRGKEVLVSHISVGNCWIAICGLTIVLGAGRRFAVEP